MKNVVLGQLALCRPWFTCGGFSGTPTVSRFRYGSLRFSLHSRDPPSSVMLRKGAEPLTAEYTDLQPVLFRAPPVPPRQQSNTSACLGFSGGSLLTYLTSAPSDLRYPFLKSA